MKRVRDDDPVRCYRGVCSTFGSRHHQEFKLEFIAPLQAPGRTIAAATIKIWIEAQQQLAGQTTHTTLWRHAP